MKIIVLEGRQFGNTCILNVLTSILILLMPINGEIFFADFINGGTSYKSSHSFRCSTEKKTPCSKNELYG